MISYQINLVNIVTLIVLLLTLTGIAPAADGEEQASTVTKWYINPNMYQLSADQLGDSMRAWGNLISAKAQFGEKVRSARENFWKTIEAGDKPSLAKSQQYIDAMRAKDYYYLLLELYDQAGEVLGAKEEGEAGGLGAVLDLITGPDIVDGGMGSASGLHSDWARAVCFTFWANLLPNGPGGGLGSDPGNALKDALEKHEADYVKYAQRRDALYFAQNRKKKLLTSGDPQLYYTGWLLATRTESNFDKATQKAESLMNFCGPEAFAATMRDLKTVTDRVRAENIAYNKNRSQPNVIQNILGAVDGDKHGDKSDANELKGWGRPIDYRNTTEGIIYGLSKGDAERYAIYLTWRHQTSLNLDEAKKLLHHRREVLGADRVNKAIEKLYLLRLDRQSPVSGDPTVIRQQYKDAGKVDPNDARLPDTLLDHLNLSPSERLKAQWLPIDLTQSQRADRRDRLENWLSDFRVRHAHNDNGELSMKTEQVIDELINMFGADLTLSLVEPDFRGDSAIIGRTSKLWAYAIQNGTPEQIVYADLFRGINGYYATADLETQINRVKRQYADFVDRYGKEKVLNATNKQKETIEFAYGGFYRFPYYRASSIKNILRGR